MANSSCHNLIFVDGNFCQNKSSSVFSCVDNQININIDENNNILEIFEQHINSDENINSENNNVININLAAHFKINHYKLAQENKSAVHNANITINLAKNSEYSHYNFSLGSLKTENNITINFNDEDSSGNLFGAYLPINKQQIINNTFLNHNSPNTKSEENYKGILRDESRAKFLGKVYVAKDAQKVDSAQMNKNLLLSDKAEIDTRPELNIYADDVKCAHGATIGDLDEDMLFYLRSRGINNAEANKLLQFAFIAEILEKIKNKEVYKVIEQEVNKYLWI